MNDTWKREADSATPLRWAVWLAFLVAWSVALLVPDPIEFLFRYKPDSLELSSEMTFLMAKALHVTAYALAAILTGWLRAPGSWRWVLLAFWFLHAGATEVGQLFVPGRTGSLRDVALDHVGLLIGLAVSWRWWRSVPPATGDKARLENSRSVDVR
jgi:VanZ family protein